MKTNKWMACIALLTALGLTACSAQDDGLDTPSEAQQGQLMLNLSSGTNFSDVTRAVNEETYKNVSNYTVQILDKEENPILECKGSELASKMPISLPIGSCTVKAYYGTESAASRDIFFVYGKGTGTIEPNKEETITVNCIPTCGRVKVAFSSDMANYFKDYKVEFSGTQKLAGDKFTWNKGDSDPWYVYVNDGGETIDFTITTTTHDDYVNADNKAQTSTQTGRFTLKRNKAYKMNVNSSYNPSYPEDGSVGINITIDESTNDINEDIEVPVTWI